MQFTLYSSLRSVLRGCLYVQRLTVSKEVTGLLSKTSNLPATTSGLNGYSVKSSITDLQPVAIEAYHLLQWLHLRNEDKENSFQDPSAVCTNLISVSILLSDTS